MYYSDRPISQESEDLLERRYFANLLAKTLLNLNSQDTFTVGLYGKWGSGKTSIVNMAMQELEDLQCDKEDKMIILKFDPWHFTDTTQLINQFLIRLANEFLSEKDKQLNNIGELLTKYSSAFELAEYLPVPWLNKAISIFGKAGAKFAGKKLQKGIKGKDILESKNIVIESLKAANKKILVVIDDIDRLTSEQIRQVFQLVSSVAKFPNTRYLLVFDKDIVVKSLVKVQEGDGEDYLEKIIQIPIQIPELQKPKLHKALFDRLNNILENNPNIHFHSDHWQKIFPYCVAPFITSLRDINRLSNSLQFKLTSIASEVDYADMIAITVLEISMPQIYEWIKNNKNLMIGGYDFSSIGGYRNTAEDWRKKYTAELLPLVPQNLQIGEMSESQIDTVLSCISYLFPSFARKIGKSSDVYDLNVLRRHNNIGHKDKFDRYFDFDLDSVFVKRAEVEELVNIKNKEEIQAYLIQAEEHQRSYEVLLEIEAQKDALTPDRIRVISSAIINISTSLKSDVESFLPISASYQAKMLIYSLLGKLGQKESFEFLKEEITRALPESLETLATLINTIELGYGRLAADGAERTEYGKIVSLEQLEEIESVFTARCKAIFDSISIFDCPKWRKVYHLLKSFDKEYAESHMRENLKKDVNIMKWLVEITSEFIGSGVSYEIRKPPYEYLEPEDILKAIDNVRNTKVLFELDEDIQCRAAAFYLNSQGQRTVMDHISQKEAKELLEKWESAI